MKLVQEIASIRLLKDRDKPLIIARGSNILYHTQKHAIPHVNPEKKKKISRPSLCNQLVQQMQKNKNVS